MQRIRILYFSEDGSLQEWRCFLASTGSAGEMVGWALSLLASPLPYRLLHFVGELLIPRAEEVLWLGVCVRPPDRVAEGLAGQPLVPEQIVRLVREGDGCRGVRMVALLFDNFYFLYGNYLCGGRLLNDLIISPHDKRARGLAVRTPPSHGGDPRFKSGRAHHKHNAGVPKRSNRQRELAEFACRDWTGMVQGHVA